MARFETVEYLKEVSEIISIKICIGMAPFWYNDFNIGTENIGVPIKIIFLAMTKLLLY